MGQLSGWLGKKRYPYYNGKYAIEIKVDTIEQLFDEKDPSPFRQKDIDDDANEFILASAKDIGLGNISKINIHVKKDFGQKMTDKELMSSIRSFYAYEEQLVKKKIKQILKVGVKSLGIGLSFLTLAVFVSVSLLNGDVSILSKVLKEGLLLTGWVSMWRPVNIFLYEWWPLVEDMKLLRSLSQIEVEIFRSAKPRLKSVS